jgi:hypothetical protein
MNDNNEADKEIARRIMWNQHSRKRQAMQYQIIAAEPCEPLARRIEETYPDRFTFHKTIWGKFPDGTDKIEMGGFVPRNLLSGEHVLFLACFHSNEVTLSQFQVMIVLLQEFIESLTVVLPYYPVGTMERVTKEGTVATAATYAHMFSSLPNCGRPTRLMVYDLHTLQNRFYLVRLMKDVCSFCLACAVYTPPSHVIHPCRLVARKRRCVVADRYSVAQEANQRLGHRLCSLP